MNSTPDSAGAPGIDPRLVVELAIAALREITPESSIGELVGHREEGDGVISLLFANRLTGYPGWLWTVSVAQVDDSEPTVLEAELLPADGALLAPDWVPWAVRLSEYRAQVAEGESADETPDDSDDEDEELDDVDDLDAADFDEDGSPLLHAGDVDGVDIDEEDESDEDDDSEDDDSEDDDSEES